MKKKMAMLLAIVLTLTQGTAVPVAAEELTWDAVWAQETTLDDDAEEAAVESVEELTVEEDTEESTEESTESTLDDTKADVEESIPNDTEEDVEEIILDEAEAAVDTFFSAGDSAGNGVALYSESDIEYDFFIGFQNNELDYILPESEDTLNTGLSYDGDEISNYSIKVTPEDDSVGMVDYEVNGTEISVKTKKTTGCVTWKVQVFVGENPDPVVDYNYQFDISGYIILSDEIDMYPEEGDEIDIKDMNPELFLYTDDATAIKGENYRIRLSEYAEDVWEVKEGSDSYLPTLVRTSPDYGYFILMAEQKVDGDWHELVSRIYVFDDLSDGEGEGGDNGNSEAESGYYLSVDFKDSIGNGDMLPNSQMTIRTALTKRSDESLVTDYKLEIVKPSKVGNATVKGTEILIESNEKLGQEWILVSVQIPGENGEYEEIFTRELPYTVSSYILLPQTVVNPQVGESIDLSKVGFVLKEYKSGEGLVEVTNPDIKYIIYAGEGDGEEIFYDYDVNGWTLTEVEGSTLPILTRKVARRTWFAVSATIGEPGTSSFVSLSRKDFYLDAVADHTHNWEAGKVTKEATCTEKGKRLDTCKCGATNEVEISAKGHTKVKDAAVAATVFATGKTEGSHCSVCGTVLKKQNTVAKLTPTISLTATSLKMKTKQSTTAFRVSGLAKGDYVKKVTAKNTKIVKVADVKKDGRFKLTAGKKKGSTTVNVLLASGKSTTFKVYVQTSAVKTSKITTTTKNLTMKIGETYTKLASTVVVAPVTSKEKITYSSSDKKVATVNSKGVIEAKGIGTTKITIKSGKEKAVVNVTVTGVRTTKLSGVPTAKTVKKGKTFTIQAVAAPKNTDEVITYKSSNKKIATVSSNGVVKGVRKGTAIITVQSGSKKLTCKVKVN